MQRSSEILLFNYKGADKFQTTFFIQYCSTFLQANNPPTLFPKRRTHNYSGLTLNQEKATKPQTVQIVRQGEATPYWFKVNPL